ncbi:hypothetical protein LDENG_00118990 [Lucifuga dentata]|nr:hypothetical protein LDENG_00118990 [Lucifuga dentata]
MIEDPLASLLQTYEHLLRLPDKTRMNFLLLTTVVFTLTLVHGLNKHPCEKNPDNNAYNKFAKKHIFQEVFDTNSKEEWKKYLQKYTLCSRPKQSFMEKSDEATIKGICNGNGRNHRINLCISMSQIQVYYIEVNVNDCSIKNKLKQNQHVIVACDKVNNQCLPVHYEKNNGQKPDPKDPVCKP